MQHEHKEEPASVIATYRTLMKLAFILMTVCKRNLK